jgi:hypothetical protein
MGRQAGERMQDKIEPSPFCQIEPSPFYLFLKTQLKHLDIFLKTWHTSMSSQIKSV